jgi:hypothetical protein
MKNSSNKPLHADLLYPTFWNNDLYDASLGHHVQDISGRNRSVWIPAKDDSRSRAILHRPGRCAPFGHEFQFKIGACSK